MVIKRRPRPPTSPPTGQPARPPPDDPLERDQQDRELDEPALAQKRLLALQQRRTPNKS
jgi:hypothetical protein